jgi:hypothetical protein
VTDKSQETLTGDKKNKAIIKCLSCADIVECAREERPIYTDGNGDCTGWKKGVSDDLPK